VSHNKGVGRASLNFAYLPRGAHHKIRARPSRLGFGHDADNLILEKKIMLRSPKGKPRPNLKGCSTKEEEVLCSFRWQPKSINFTAHFTLILGVGCMNFKTLHCSCICCDLTF
jgi:hypothetical protein